MGIFDGTTGKAVVGMLGQAAALKDAFINSDANITTGVVGLFGQADAVIKDTGAKITTSASTIFSVNSQIFLGGATGHNYFKERQIMANPQAINNLIQRLSDIRTKEVENAREACKTAIRALNKVNGFDKYGTPGGINVAGYDDIFDGISNAIYHLTQEIDGKLKKIIKYQNASGSEKFASAVGVASGKIFEGFLTPFEAITDAVGSSGALFADGLSKVTGWLGLDKMSISYKAGSNLWSDIAAQNTVHDALWNKDGIFNPILKYANEDTAFAETFKFAGEVGGYVVLGAGASALAGGAKTPAILKTIKGFKITSTTVGNSVVGGLTGYGSRTATQLQKGDDILKASGKGTLQGIAQGGIAFGAGFVADNSSTIISKITGKGNNSVTNGAASGASTTANQVDDVAAAGVRPGNVAKAQETMNLADDALNQADDLYNSAYEKAVKAYAEGGEEGAREALKELAAAEQNYIQVSQEIMGAQKILDAAGVSTASSATNAAASSAAASSAKSSIINRATNVLKTLGTKTLETALKHPNLIKGAGVIANAAILNTTTNENIAMDKIKNGTPGQIDKDLNKVPDDGIFIKEETKKVDPIAGTPGSSRIKEPKPKPNPKPPKPEKIDPPTDPPTEALERKIEFDPETFAPKEVEPTTPPTEVPTEKIEPTTPPTEVPTERVETTPPTEVPTERVETTPPTEVPTERVEPTTPPTEAPREETYTPSAQPSQSNNGGYYNNGGWEETVQPEPEPVPNLEEVSLDDVIEGGKYTKIPTSSAPLNNTITPKSSGGSSVIPIVAGLSAAAAAGIGAKAYIDRKNNRDNGEEETFEESSDWSEGDGIVINENIENVESIEADSDESNYLSDDDDYSYQTVETEKYGARSNDELADLQ